MEILPILHSHPTTLFIELCYEKWPQSLLKFSSLIEEVNINTTQTLHQIIKLKNRFLNQNDEKILHKSVILNFTMYLLNFFHQHSERNQTAKEGTMANTGIDVTSELTRALRYPRLDMNKGNTWFCNISSI